MHRRSTGRRNGRGAFYVIVRGPLGVGKTTVSRRLAAVLGATYFSVDRALDAHRLWRSGRLAEFLRANEYIVPQARAVLRADSPVVIDGNFYWKTQLRQLRAALAYPHRVVTLAAPLSVCIDRDAGRRSPHGAAAARAVYSKSTRFEAGFRIKATRPVDEIVRDVARRLPGARAQRVRARSAAEERQGAHRRL